MLKEKERSVLSGSSRLKTSCFPKYRWFLQEECRDCSLGEECKKASLIRRANRRGERIKKAHEIIHPNILNHRYDFLDK